MTVMVLVALEVANNATVSPTILGSVTSTGSSLPSSSVRSSTVVSSGAEVSSVTSVVSSGGADVSVASEGSLVSSLLLSVGSSPSDDAWATGTNEITNASSRINAVIVLSLFFMAFSFFFGIKNTPLR